MRCSRITWAVALAIASAAAVGGSSFVRPQVPVGDSRTGKKDRARVTVSKALPKLDGGHLTVTLVEVDYGPGESSPPHTHPCAVIAYVVKGALRTQVQGEPQTVYQAGQSFYEPPGGVHLVSANASATEPAKFLAYFICDHAVPLSMDAPKRANRKGK